MKTSALLVAAVLAGRILATDSTNPGTTRPVVGVRVNLRPLSWVPGAPAEPAVLQTTVTDTAGTYRFANPPPRTYRIEARDMGRGWSKTVKVAANDTIRIPEATIQKWGRLFVEVEMRDSLRGGELYFYGLDRSVRIPDTGTREWKHLIDSLPVGLQTICLWSKKTNSVIVNLPVRIGPDSTSKIEYEHGKMGVEGPEEDD